MEKFRKNKSGDTYIKFNSETSITKIVVREYGQFKQFLYDTNEISEKQVELIKLHYPILTNEKNYFKHLEKLHECILTECCALLTQTPN